MISGVFDGTGVVFGRALRFLTSGWGVVLLLTILVWSAILIAQFPVDAVAAPAGDWHIQAEDGDVGYVKCEAGQLRLVPLGTDTLQVICDESDK